MKLCNYTKMKILPKKALHFTGSFVLYSRDYYREGEAMKKAIKWIIIVVSVIAAAILGLYCYVYETGSTQEYTNDFRRIVFDSTYMNAPGNNEMCVIEIVDYNMLAAKYRRIVSEEEFESAKTEDQIFDIYRRIAAENNNQISEAAIDMFVSTTYGYKMAEGMDCFIIGSQAYRVYHYFDFKPQLFSDKPYISKWMIEINEIDNNETGGNDDEKE